MLTPTVRVLGGWAEMEAAAGGWLLPEGVSASRLRLQAAEGGGGGTKSGQSQIVCDRNGRALHSSVSGKRRDCTCKEHARFESSDLLVTVEAMWAKSNGTPLMVAVRSHRLQIQGNLVTIATEELWSGEPDGLLPELSKFFAAMVAAIEKCQCWHCQRCHYAAGERLCGK